MARADKAKSRFLLIDGAIAAIFLLAYLWCANGFFSPNMVARIALSHAMAARGSFDIDEMQSQTIDKAKWQGHYYCDKAPGMSLFCVPAVFVADKVADALGKPPELTKTGDHTTLRYVLDCFACLLSTTILASVAMLVMFRRTLVRAGTSARVAGLTTLALGFGTPFFTWSTSVLGHATAAAFLFLAFSAAWWERPVARGKWVAVGALLGAAVLTEFIAAPPAAMIALFLLWRGERTAAVFASRAALLALGGIPFLLALGWYNWAAFGSPLHLGYTSTQGFEGMKTGFFGISAPNWRAFWGITFGSYRGIAWLSPVTIIAAVAAVALLFQRSTRPVAAVIVGVTASYLLINSGYYYWDGGGSLGPRHITPVLPFLFFALGLWVARLGHAARVVIALIGGISALIEIVSTCVIFTPPPDGAPLLAGRVLPGLMNGSSELILAKMQVPFAALLAIPLMLALAGMTLVWRNSSAPRARQAL